MSGLGGFPSILGRPVSRIDTPDDGLVEALMLAVDADALEELADEADPERVVAPITDVRTLAATNNGDPGNLRGGAALLRDNARRMVDALPAWREARARHH